jgi:hypothetical protein
MDYEKLEKLLFEFPIEHMSGYPSLLCLNIKNFLKSTHKDQYIAIENSKSNFASRMSFFKRQFWSCKRDKESVEKMLIGIFYPELHALPDKIFDTKRLRTPDKEKK